MTDPAALLTAAASKLEGLAGEASSDWAVERGFGGYAGLGGDSGIVWEASSLSDAAFIASMSPLLATALATWLRVAAGVIERGGMPDAEVDAAVLVARRVLGEAG